MHVVNAVLSVQTMLDYKSVRVNEVKGSVGVVLGARREHADLVELGQEVKGHVKIWSHFNRDL